MQSSVIDRRGLLRSGALARFAGSLSCGHTVATRAAPTAVSSSEEVVPAASKTAVPRAHGILTKAPDPPASAA